MRRYALILVGLMAFFLLLFGLAEALKIPLLSDPGPWMREAGPSAMAVGVGLLILDVFLPIPSSVVMIAHGALFGAWHGALLSMTGCLGAAAFGFALGRRGGPLLRRLVSADEKKQVDALLLRWGALAVLVTRPLPLLAEATAIMAGTSPMPWGRMLMAAFLGSLPASALYALAGATSAKVTGGLWIFALVVALAGLFWWAGRIAAVAIARRMQDRVNKG